MSSLSSLRQIIRSHHLADEGTVIEQLTRQANLTSDQRTQISKRATALVCGIRSDDRPGLMEIFLAEYGLSTDEGVALMCLAEALLRVPDAETMDELIEDKIAPSGWGAHLGKSSSSLVNASTWALMLTGKVLDESEADGVTGVLRGAVKRLGEPVIRRAVRRAMKEMGNQFVLGETIEAAIERGRAMEKQGHTYSYDMLGEAALTARDADEFFQSYKAAIEALSKRAKSTDVRENPGISIKLSALHPRFEVAQKDRVMGELVPRLLDLIVIAKNANMGLNVDAEEADRLDLSLDVIEAAMRDERLAGWDGFGIVVQAYGKRAAPVLDWLYQLAGDLSRKIMVRLVKGAYWDTEIKRSQVEGLADFPVFTRKSATDVSYICCAKKLLAMTDRIYPQFATHNAHSVSAILELASDRNAFEFQRLHGMGEAMHRQVLTQEGTRCRIYAPVGIHADLLAYLVRRLLENGANSSFVNQIVDETVPAETIAQDPFASVEQSAQMRPTAIRAPRDLFAPERRNSTGWDLRNVDDLATIDAEREAFKDARWEAGPLLAVPFAGLTSTEVRNPANPDDLVGVVINAVEADAAAALDAASKWHLASASERAIVLNRAADLYEEHFGELFAVLTREAGKSLMDAIAELREAVDFLRYYATFTEMEPGREPLGLVTCISPWNFPLAIFIGQIAAGLAAGNGVLAKPAEQTPIVAYLAVQLLHQAGVPRDVLQFLPGEGRIVGEKLTADPRTKGVCFTGSTETAQRINRTLAAYGAPDAPLIAETGGLNCMIVDSTALPEQVVKDILISSFQSAGQRCSALRVLYLQKDIAPVFLEMLFGAVDEMVIGDPWLLHTDVGPVITEPAREKIEAYIRLAEAEGRLLKQRSVQERGIFVGPAVIEVQGISDIAEEIFGPVLHVATFEATEIDRVIDEINASGYGLTFGLHTRIDDRVEHITTRLNVGNMYINRNQIGAIVGSQPFGGEGLSGTGPKAGGPNYVRKFTRSTPKHKSENDGEAFPERGSPLTFELLRRELRAAPGRERSALSTIELPGPTGESNRLAHYARGTILCLGPGLEVATEQARIARAYGCHAVICCPGASGENAIDGMLNPEDLEHLDGINAVAFRGQGEELRGVRRAVSARDGALIPLLSDRNMAQHCIVERHICIDTTASGGNASLLASAS